MTTFLDKPASLSTLSKELNDKLSTVPDYPLDYNIFLFKGIKDSRKDFEKELIDLRLDIFQSIPEEYGRLVFKGVEEGSNGDKILIHTTTSKLQDRLLELLILERHRRDIDILNKMLDTKPGNDAHIKLVQLEDPFKYEIKSPIYNSFQANADSYKESFKKFNILQNIEYSWIQ
ncbi:unnamed protein product [Ambrosiozyma monospora]|uniref:Unnamed protein product n=1 Tax=Ambrosiozyma monospora TaxID=43982 RepID=A0ACB5U013_AMBMO|nr:unnamed protein product [Ambrosiozyma monospora]